MAFKNLKTSKRTSLIIWIIIIAFIVAAPTILPVFRLNLLGRYLSLAIVALGVDLISVSYTHLTLPTNREV